MTTRRLLLPGVLLVLPGCLGTRAEKIETRRAPSLIAKQERSGRPRSPEEIDDEALALEEANRLSPELAASTARLVATRKAVEAIYASIPRDPWQAEDADRRRVLFRRWADVATPLPEPEPAAKPADAAAPRPEDDAGGGE